MPELSADVITDLPQRYTDRADTEACIRAQISREERLEESDFVVDNSGDRTALEAEVVRLWEWLTADRP
jgi:dephospho-CoA kinase